MELSRLVRNAFAALSSMVTRSLAWTTSMGRSRWPSCYFQFPADHVLLAHQNDFHSEVSGGPNRPFDFGFRGVIAAHCIHGNGQHVGCGYSWTTSITSRPLYCPQCGHTRCGSLGSWQLGHSEKPGAFRASCARRVLVRSLECLRLGFGISLPQYSILPRCGGRLNFFKSLTSGARPSDRPPVSALQSQATSSDSCRKRDKFLCSLRCKPAASAAPAESVPEGYPPVPARRLDKNRFPPRLRRSRLLPRARSQKPADKTDRIRHRAGDATFLRQRSHGAVNSTV